MSSLQPKFDFERKKSVERSKQQFMCPEEYFADFFPENCFFIYLILLEVERNVFRNWRKKFGRDVQKLYVSERTLWRETFSSQTHTFLNVSGLVCWQNSYCRFVKLAFATSGGTFWRGVFFFQKTMIFLSVQTSSSNFTADLSKLSSTCPEELLYKTYLKTFY